MVRNKDRIAAFESHLQHELRSLDGKRLRKRLNHEISALFEWFEEVSLNDFLTAGLVWKRFQRNVIDFPISDEIVTFLTECTKKIHSCVRNDETRLEEVIPREQYDRVMENLIDLEDLRNEIIHQMVSSKIFSMMISNALYKGIKGFIVSENILVKNIPGASSLLKVGIELMNITTLGLAGSIDEKMKGFVENNIQNILRDSEKFLVASLDEALLKELANQLWEASTKYRGNSTIDYIGTRHIESTAPVVRDFWLHLRKSAIFSKLCRTLIDYFFERNGDKKIRTLLEEIGITEDRILGEVNEIAKPVFKNRAFRSYLEKRIRTRLEGYYFSENGKGPVKKPAGRKKPSMKTPNDIVLSIIKNSSHGVTVPQIKKKTGFSDTKIRGIIYRLKKLDRIKNKHRGVYVKV